MSGSRQWPSMVATVIKRDTNRHLYFLKESHTSPCQVVLSQKYPTCIWSCLQDVTTYLEETQYLGERVVTPLCCNQPNWYCENSPDASVKSYKDKYIHTCVYVDIYTYMYIHTYNIHLYTYISYICLYVLYMYLYK